MPLVINGRFLARPETGVERYGRMLLRIVAREWPDHRIIVPQNAIGIDLSDREVIRFGRSDGHLWEQLELPRALRTGDLLLSPANTGPLRVRRQVVAIHDLAAIHHPEWFDRRFALWYGQLLPRLARRAQGVITVSRHSADDLVRTFSLPQDQVHLVPPFADLRPPSAQADAGSPYCLVVASNDPRKGLDDLFAWYGQLVDPPFRLVVVGRSGRAFAPTGQTPMRGVLRPAEVDDAELSALYANAMALIQPSRSEGFGLPILEAMHLGCPVIASDLPVFRELFGDAPIFVDPKDHAQLSQAIELLAHASLRRSRITRGHACAARFSEAHMTDRLHAVLDPLLHE